MILYKRFRGHEPSPDALLKSRTVVDLENRLTFF
jgi:hypothetical protein